MSSEASRLSGSFSSITEGSITSHSIRAREACAAWKRIASAGISPAPAKSTGSPAGVVTTARDPQGRRTVVDLVGHEARVVPVGRLDADTTGALLLTNDGDLAHRLAHPRYGVEKVYVAETWKQPDDAALERLRTGVELEDGRTAPAGVRRLAGASIAEIRMPGGTLSVEFLPDGGRVLLRGKSRFVFQGAIDLATLVSGRARRQARRA